MKLPRDLSGEELVKHLSKRWDYVKIHQVGSHIILQTQHPTPHRIAVPEHTPLRIGTLNAILSSIAAHKSVSKEAILKDI
ncbi:MAG: type II toxin-antitoxin system HicA family toxin [Terracidiphilus sp.]|jgi:predicted RNA binding protein YcfA (HicA-like mRNA interferase family)